MSKGSHVQVGRTSQESGEHFAEVRMSHLRDLDNQIEELKGQLVLAYSVLGALGFEIVELIQASLT